MNKALNIALGTLIAVGISAPAAAENWLDQIGLKAAATYTKPTNNGLDFGFSPTAPGPADWRPFFVEPSHEWDFFGGVEFKTSKEGDTRLFVEYDHYNNKKEREATGLGFYGFALPAANLSKMDVKHDEHDLKFGIRHDLHFGQYFDFVLGGYFEYANVERTQNYLNTSPVGVLYLGATTEDQMKGWGPGVDALGRIFPCGNQNRNWSLFFGAGLGLLWSDIEYKFHAASPLGGGFATSLSPEESQAIVTKVETNLGLEYSRLLQSEVGNLVVGARLGLKYMNYLNAFKGGNFNNLQPVPAPVGSFNYTANPAYDYGRMGPFLEFRLGGAHS